MGPLPLCNQADLTPLFHARPNASIGDLHHRSLSLASAVFPARSPPRAAKLRPRCFYLPCKHLCARAAACAPRLGHAQQPPRTARRAQSRLAQRMHAPRGYDSLRAAEGLRSRPQREGAGDARLPATHSATRAVRAQSRCSRQRTARRSRTDTAGVHRVSTLRSALHAAARRCWPSLAASLECSWRAGLSRWRAPAAHLSAP